MLIAFVYPVIQPARLAELRQEENTEIYPQQGLLSSSSISNHAKQEIMKYSFSFLLHLAFYLG